MELVINNTGLALQLSSPQEKYILGQAAQGQQAEDARFKNLSRRYHMKKKATPGLDYDDRLYKRLACSPNTAYKYVSEGAIRAVFMGNRIVVAESAVMRYQDPQGYADLMGLSHSKAA